jgi:serine protease
MKTDCSSRRCFTAEPCKNQSFCTIIGILLAGIIVGSTITPAHAEGEIKRRALPVKPERAKIEAYQRTDRIYVVFQDGLKIRERAGTLWDGGAGVLNHAAGVLAKLNGARWAPVHRAPEGKLKEMRETAIKNLKREVPDLSLQFYCSLPAGIDAAAAIDWLNSLPIVEIAMPVPKAAKPQVPNFMPQQTYLNPAPAGMDVLTAWNQYNEHGETVRYADVEYSFNTGHADLPKIYILGLGGADLPVEEYYHHGTAALGVFSMRNNGWGGTGAAWAALPFFSYAADASGNNDIPDAVTRCMSQLKAGDLIAVEIALIGPNSKPVPVEWDRAVYDAVVTAVGNGITVVEAAGNGSANLDDPIYSTGNNGHYPFRPENDSGAIIVGAGTPGNATPAYSRMSFSNYGSTVDLQGQGQGIVTAGYGDLYFEEGANRYFTAGFGGTSGATTMVGSAAMLLQSAYKKALGISLPPAQVKTRLQQTGHPQPPTEWNQNIGPAPNLAAAMNGFIPRSSWSVKINFQPPGAPTPPGYTPDTGDAYGFRNNLNYGWSAPNPNGRDLNHPESKDQRYDTFNAMQKGSSSWTWNLGVVNGTYAVTVVAGDPSEFTSIYDIDVEGVRAIQGTTPPASPWLVGTVRVNVNDGKLTISNAEGAVGNKIAFIEVNRVDTLASLTHGAIYRLTPKFALASALEVYGFGTANRSNVVIWQYFGGANQKWKAIDAGNDYWEFEPVHAPGKRLDVDGGLNQNKRNVWIWQANSTAAQKWRVYDLGDGSFGLAPQCAPGRRLDVSNNSAANGQNVWIYDYHGGANQRWIFSTGAGVNLALNRPVTVSSSLESGGWSKFKLVDGLRVIPGWSSNNTPTVNHSEWVQVDLGGSYNVARVDLYPRLDEVSQGYGFPVDFTIQRSTDGVNWTTVITRTGYPKPLDEVQTFTFLVGRARYIRVNGTKLRPNPNERNEYRMQFAEMEVY